MSALIGICNDPRKPRACGVAFGYRPIEVRTAVLKASRVGRYRLETRDAVSSGRSEASIQLASVNVLNHVAWRRVNLIVSRTISRSASSSVDRPSR